MHITTIGKYTALEALRTRVPATALLTLLLLVCASLFVRELAVTEASRFQTAFYAAAARLCAVFLIGVYVLASMTREFNDKGLEVVLALDVPRAHYICGKLAGFIVAAMLIAVIVALPLWALATPAPVSIWTASLVMELALVAALSLFCVVTGSATSACRSCQGCLSTRVEIGSGARRYFRKPHYVAQHQWAVAPRITCELAKTRCGRRPVRIG